MIIIFLFLFFECVYLSCKYKKTYQTKSTALQPEQEDMHFVQKIPFVFRLIGYGHTHRFVNILDLLLVCGGFLIIGVKLEHSSVSS